MSLEVKVGEVVRLSVPLGTEVDAGNYIHLLAEFSAQREAVSKMQIIFDVHRGAGRQMCVIDLKAFIDRS